MNGPTKLVMCLHHSQLGASINFMATKNLTLSVIGGIQSPLKEARSFGIKPIVIALINSEGIYLDYLKWIDLDFNIYLEQRMSYCF